MANAPISSIAVFGATGNLGTSVIKAITSTGRHKVTAIVRSQSKAVLPAAVKVLKGDLTSPQFLTTSLQGHDAVIIALGLDASHSIDEEIVTAAAQVGVKWILPNEFVSQDSLRQHFPFGVHEKKNRIRKLIEDLGISRWIAIVNGTWYDFSLLAGSYGIDIQNRRAVIWTPATAAANMTTLATVGKSVAGLLSLDHVQLDECANRCIYISSFRVSQLEILHSVQRATRTETIDWDIAYEDVHEAVRDGQDSASNGNMEGFIKVIYAMQFLPGAGGDYEATHGTANTMLELPKEDIDTVTQSLITQV